MVQAGKRYLVTREDLNTVRRFTARVNWVEDRGDFWYIGYEPDDKRVCQFGAVKVKKVGQFRRINYSFKEV